MSSYTLHDNVSIGESTTIGDFVILGEPARGDKAGEVELVIGAKSTIRSHTVIYAGNIIGDNFQTGHGVLIREKNEIGNNVSIGSSTVVEHHVIIGNNVRIHSQAFVPEFSVLEDGVWIGPNVVVTNAQYPNTADAKSNLKGPYFEEGAVIGANSTILPGVRIGKKAVVGAGSVVTKDVTSGDVVAGNPAKFIKRVSDIPSYQ